MNLLVPLAAVQGLSVPPAAITDGSADPVWVELPVQGGYVYGRKRRLRLPLDAATAVTAHRWLRFDRRQRLVFTPVFVALMLTAFAMLLLPDDRFDEVRLTLYVAGFSLQLWTRHAERKLIVAQHPELIGRLGIYLPALPPEVAQEWIRRNAGVRAVPERPRWRRYPSTVYGWAAAGYAVTAAAVWWLGLRDGEFDLITGLAFVALVVAAVVSAFKALPLGYIRFDTPESR